MSEEDAYIKLDYFYMIIGNRFFTLHEIPFSIGHNLREGCKVYKFDRIEEKWNDNDSNTS